jgi:phosphatidylglycerophosphatase A
LAFLRNTDPPRAALLSPPVLAGSMGLVGFVPFGRGTAGTLLCLPLALGLYYGVDWYGLAWLPLAGGFSLLSWLAGVAVLRGATKIKDPSWFVLDEAAGYFLTLGLLRAHSPLDILAGLLTFRVYDIAKPWPVRSFERIPGSLGILMDDLAAAVLAAWTWYTIAVLSSALG